MYKLKSYKDMLYNTGNIVIFNNNDKWNRTLKICKSLCWIPENYIILYIHYLWESVSRSVVSDSLWPYRLWPDRLLCPGNSPGKNTGVSNHSLLQGIFLTQGLNLDLMHCRQILYCLSHQGSPYQTIPQLKKVSLKYPWRCARLWFQDWKDSRDQNKQAPHPPSPHLTELTLEIDNKQ